MKMVKYHYPDVLFVSETKLVCSEIDNIKNSLNFDCCYCVDSNRRRGGIGLFWYNNTNIIILSSSQYWVLW